MTCRSRRAPTPHVLLLVAACLGACGGASSDPIPDWSAGAGLLDDPRLLSWDLEAGADLPVDVVDADTREPDVPRVVVRPDEWIPRDDLSRAQLASWGVEAGARVFEATPVARVRLGGERPRLHVEGRDLSRKRLAGVSNVWRDDETGHMYWWRRDGLLTAVGPGEPGHVELIGDTTAPGAEAARPTLRDRGPRPTSVTLGDTTRRAVFVPAPGTLRTPARRVEAGRLHVAMGLCDRAYRSSDGRLLHRPVGGLPVTVRIQAVDEQGRARTLVERALRKTPDRASWETLVVDLAPVAGRTVAFTFSAEPVQAPGGHVPLVAWADLVFTGGGSPARGGRPHVVVISLDTLRPDRLGVYGHDRRTSPRLDAWAMRRAQVFEDAMADSNWTLPSTATMLTGLATRQHELLAFPATLGPSTPTLAERLAAEGYETLAITDGGFVRPAFGFDRGFDRFTVDASPVPDWRPALDRLSRRGRDRPVFLFLHTYLTHAPWPLDPRFSDASRPYDGPLADRDLTDDVIDAVERGDLVLDAEDHAEVRRLYDAGIARMDQVVGAFLEELEQIVDPADRLVVVTSDHGEHLFDHGYVAHGRTLFDAVLRVPLLVSWPGARPLGRTRAPAAGVDVVPTVLDVLGLEVPEGLPGRSLRSAGDEQVLRVGQHADSVLAAVLDGWKLVAPCDGEGPVQLYHLPTDPGELDDVSALEPVRAARLRELLDAWLAKHPPRGEAGDADGLIDPALAADLRALGYLGDDG